MRGESKANGFAASCSAAPCPFSAALTDTGTPDPFESSTSYIGLRGEYEHLWNVYDDWPAVFLGIGTRAWVRDIRDATSQSGVDVAPGQQTWWTIYPYVGLEKKWLRPNGSELFFSGRLGATVLTYQRTQWPDDPAFYPRPGITGQVELGWRTPRFFVSGYFEAMELAKLAGRAPAQRLHDRLLLFARRADVYDGAESRLVFLRYGRRNAAARAFLPVTAIDVKSLQVRHSVPDDLLSASFLSQFLLPLEWGWSYSDALWQRQKPAPTPPLQRAHRIRRSAMRSVRWLLLLGFLGGTATVSAGVPVGVIGGPDHLAIAGAKTFSARQIKDALSLSLALQAAAERGVPRDQYLRMVEQLVWAGYRKAGFPKVQVSVGTEAGAHAVTVNVKEGPRYLAGKFAFAGQGRFPVPSSSSG